MVQVAFDTGGTFTDVAILDAERGFVLEKHLSTPRNPAEAILDGMSKALHRLGRTFSEIDMVLGATTLVTNALIERKGACTALITTEGFRDTLEMRREDRYDNFDLQLELPHAYIPRDLRFEVKERITKDGRVVVPLDSNQVEKLISVIIRKGVESVAVCFLHSYRNPEHESAVRELLQRLAPNMPVTTSGEVAPEIREYERMSTTAINAYTQPLMMQHVDALNRVLEDRGFHGKFYFMLSSGRTSTASFAARFPAHVVESGPAAGAIVASYVAKRGGFRDVISLDMGGTTAKICVMPSGEPTISRSSEVARTRRFSKGSGHPLKLSTLELIEIGAGGGSIAFVDQLGLLKVGPASAGADPGPACYGRGSANPTVTDANLLLGYLDPEYFLGGTMPLDMGAAEKVIAHLATRCGLSPLEAAWGVHEVANENMARALRVHSAELGIDPRPFTVVAFGGAGPTHACRVARKVGASTVLCPPGAGVASALGLLVASPGMDLAFSRPELLDKIRPGVIREQLKDLKALGIDALTQMGVPGSALQHKIAVDMRYEGQMEEIEIPLPKLPLNDVEWLTYVRRQFDATYQTMFGRSYPEISVEAITWRLSVFDSRVSELWWAHGDGTPQKEETRRSYFPELGGLVDTPVFKRENLPRAWTREGPLVIQERESTIVIPPRARVSLDSLGNLIIAV